MKSRFTLFFFFFLLKSTISSEDNFTFNGFHGANLTLDGLALITSSGLLELTSNTNNIKGHAFHPIPFHFKSQAGKILSFSTTFVFAIFPEFTDLGGGQGIAFVVSRTDNLSTAFPGSYFGLFNMKNNGNSTNQILAVELDTNMSTEFQDIDGNHVGIDINNLKSYNSHTAGYYDNNTGLFKNLTLVSGQPMQVWVDFDGEEMQLNVTLSPIRMPKPKKPLLSSVIDLPSVFHDSMYVGFSSSTGAYPTSHYILGWSFKMNGVAEALTYAELPALPRFKVNNTSNGLKIWLPTVFCSFVLLIVIATIFIVRRMKKYAEVFEDWEDKYGPHRFSYKDLFQATKGFEEKGLLGTGGFGRVYRGVLPSSRMEVAVKKVSHESRPGVKEFVAEIVSIGQLRHRNLVQLLGYCRRKRELLLVYDFMYNGSLDKFLYERTHPTLTWAQRFRIIKGIAAGLLYLHEDCEQVVVHRDIKASNVLLDGEMNGRLGDFGLARLYDRGTDPQTTHVVGTIGYLAPELIENGKATTLTDVFAFGAFLLEVVCGRRPIECRQNGAELILVDWVLENWQRGVLIETRDPRLGEDYCVYDVELILKLGLLCSHPIPTARPSMRQVMQILEGDTLLPNDILAGCLGFSTLLLHPNIGFDDFVSESA